uniref:Cytochrome c554 and c-prime n=1 Tax=Candidatus Kentrum sp. LFY TaxID=2126342 RepID=A0A450UA94_9GAMM|nr:MAG: Cytochrome c554 and c-prime [Candidatus Kentron sp. LFY]
MDHRHFRCPVTSCSRLGPALGQGRLGPVRAVVSIVVGELHHPIRTKPLSRIVSILLLWLVSKPLSGIEAPSPLPSPPNGASSTGEFLRWFWERPLAEQGTLAISPDLPDPPLVPEACEPCHASQYNDWMGSRHAHAMGAGAIGQFFAMSEAERQACLDCHAPLHEQSETLTEYIEDSMWAEPASQDHASTNTQNRPLHERGVICGACHMRAGRWYGPPRRGESLPPEDLGALPHHGWVSSDAFEDSRFCAACHQFPPDGFRLDGKLIENTYEEWRASPQARLGVQCQTCHMPDRRHLFRGIHDPETVRGGVNAGSESFSIAEGTIRVLVFLTNTATGHRLPTYVTPEIRLEAYQTDIDGEAIPDTTQIRWVARKVSLDLGKEYFDTRLAPGETATLAYRKPLSRHADALVARIYVEPDALYSRIYQALLELSPDGEGAPLIREALAESKRSGFSLYEKHYPIPKGRHREQKP